MNVTNARWGNSLGVRIPKSLAQQVGFSEGSHIRMEVEGNKVIISAVKPQYRLSDLLGDMSPDSMRDAFDWGDDAGRENVE